MLDLKELERKLDEALAKETPETMTAWLLSERLSMPELRHGKIVRLSVQRKSFVLAKAASLNPANGLPDKFKKSPLALAA